LGGWANFVCVCKYPNYRALSLEDEMIERGAVTEGGLWRVLEVTNEGLFVLMLPERNDIVHPRNLSGGSTQTLATN
jgi:hypothetical protein